MQRNVGGYLKIGDCKDALKMKQNKFVMQSLNPKDGRDSRDMQ
jgi:hypothetical protein